MLNAKLVVVGGDAKAAEVRLKLPTVIGRGKEAGLTVPHALVSRRHTEIFEREGRLYVRDLGSLNGTFVNNKRIEGDFPLDPDQLLTLGNITFRAVYEVRSVSEEVQFDEVKTAAAENQPVEMKAESNSSLAKPFDETVPIDPVKSRSASSDAETEAAPIIQPGPAKAEPPAGSPNAIDDAGDDVSTSDTDKSFVHETKNDGSVIGNSAFQFGSDVLDPASQSVSASAINDLPAGQPAVSFVADIDVGDEAANKPISQIDSVEIEVGDEKKKPNVVEDSSLGSFLRKLPR